jgi:hypothetical protein
MPARSPDGAKRNPGNDDLGFRRRWLHGVSTQVEAGIDRRLIHDLWV